MKVSTARGHSAPAELENCIFATKFEIMCAPFNRVRDNRNRELKEGMREIQQLQKEMRLVIKRSDKFLSSFIPKQQRTLHQGHHGGLLLSN